MAPGGILPPKRRRAMTQQLTPDRKKDRTALRRWQPCEDVKPVVFRAKGPSLTSGPPARISWPSRSVTTSARCTSRPWRLIFERRAALHRSVDGGNDPMVQVQLDFPTRQAAIAFAEREKLNYVVQNPAPDLFHPSGRPFPRSPQFEQPLIFERPLKEPTQANSRSQGTNFQVEGSSIVHERLLCRRDFLRND